MPHQIYIYEKCISNTSLSAWDVHHNVTRIPMTNVGFEATAYLGHMQNMKAFGRLNVFLMADVDRYPPFAEVYAMLGTKGPTSGRLGLHPFLDDQDGVLTACVL